MEKNENKTLNRYRFALLSPEIKFVIRKYITSNIWKLFTIIAPILWLMLPAKCKRFDRPIFIIGVSRSGTTLFLDMFAKHKDLANFSEASEVFEPFYYSRNVDHVKKRKDVTFYNRCRIKFVFGLFTCVMRKSRLLNKHPQNSLRISFLVELFSDAIFLHLIRDGRAAVFSNVSQVSRDRYRQKIPFGSFPKPESWREYIKLDEVSQYSHQWVDLINEIRNTVVKEGVLKSYYEIKFEEFCENPGKIISEVDKFCGLDQENRKMQDIPEMFSPANDKFRHSFSQEQIMVMMSIIGSTQESLGYPLETEQMLRSD